MAHLLHLLSRNLVPSAAMAPSTLCRSSRAGDSFQAICLWVQQFFLEVSFFLFSFFFFFLRGGVVLRLWYTCIPGLSTMHVCRDLNRWSIMKEPVAS